MNRPAKTSFTSLALMMILAAMPPSATAEVQIFSTGEYGFPETISLAPSGFGAFGGHYFIPDARNPGADKIWVVPVTGGPPAPFFNATGGRGGLFLPSGWGEFSGKFLVVDTDMRVFDSAGNGTLFDPQTGGFTTPLIAPEGFGTFGGDLFVSDQDLFGFSGFIWRADPAGGGLTLFKDIGSCPWRPVTEMCWP